METDEWLRLPPTGEKCEVTGCHRSSLQEILNEVDPDTGEKRVLSMVKRKPGAKRGIRLFSRNSIMAYLREEAEKQNGLRFADHILNPHKLTVENVLSSRELFRIFIDPDCEISDEDWESGVLSTRRHRLVVLRQTGVVVLNSLSTFSGDEEG